MKFNRHTLLLVFHNLFPSAKEGNATNWTPVSLCDPEWPHKPNNLARTEHQSVSPITFFQELRNVRQTRLSSQVPFCRPAVRTRASHVQPLSLYGAGARRPSLEVFNALPAVGTLRTTFPCLIEVTQIKASHHPAKQPWLTQTTSYMLQRSSPHPSTHPSLIFCLISLQQCCYIYLISLMSQ